MKIVARAVFARLELAPASPRPEPTGRRSITFSPAGGATVILPRAPRRSRPRPARAGRSPQPPEPHQDSVRARYPRVG